MAEMQGTGAMEEMLRVLEAYHNAGQEPSPKQVNAVLRTLLRTNIALINLAVKQNG